MSSASRTREAARTHRPSASPGLERSSCFAARATGLAPQIALDLQRSPGQPLDATMRSFFEQRFDHDFSRVRVHTDEVASRSVRSVEAHAYTLGNDIAFDRGRYEPRTVGGVRRLSHELAHVVQQDKANGKSDHLRIGETESASEREADRAGDSVLAGGRPTKLTAVPGEGAVVQRSVGDAVALGALGGLAGLVAGSLFHHPLIGLGLGIVGGLVAHAIFGSGGPRLKTLGGEWHTDTYDTIKNGGTDVGVDIDLVFSPQPPVNATKIGLTQTATSRSAGAPIAINPTVGARSIPAGQPGAGAHIDQLAQFRNPMYATGATSPADTLASTPTSKQWGQHGWLYKDAAGKEKKQDAHLIDKPQLAVANNSSQIFESAALAIDGVQAGMTYGSVQWGWTRDGVGNFSKLPLKVVGYGTPTAQFRQAAALWNANPTSTGAATIPLPAMQTESAAIEASLNVPDYATAYLILHTQPMAAMLTTLLDLNAHGRLTTLYINLGLARGVDVLRLRTAIEAVLHRQNQAPLSPDFNDWLDPAKNPRADEIAAIRHFLGMA